MGHLHEILDAFGLGTTVAVDGAVVGKMVADVEKIYTDSITLQCQHA